MQVFQLIPQLGLWAQQHVSLILWSMAGLFLLMIVTNICTRRRRGNLTTHGSARWSTPREIHQAGLSTRHGVVIGEVQR